MSNTYTQIHIHTIFAVQNRMSLINNEWKERLYQYLVPMIEKHNHKVLAIGGMPDHIHLLFGFRPNHKLSDLVQEIKRDSTLWINKNGFAMGKFSWQEGYGGFSYGKSQLDTIIKYIHNQEIHHTNKDMVIEYKAFLDSFGVEYDERYIFQKVL